MPRIDLSRARPLAGWVGWILGLGLLAAVTTLPYSAQRTAESLRFDDLLGTVPVEVTMVRNGYSVVDAGILGAVYWERTGPFGLGAHLRVTGPPNAGGTLASYVDPDFLKVNTATVDDPAAVGRAYAAELGNRFARGLAERAVVLGAVGGVALALILRPRLRAADRRRRVLVVGGVGLGLLVTSTGVAAAQYAVWPGSEEPPRLYALPGRASVAFSSAQALEVAEQVQPFVEKNVERLRDRADDYEADASASLRAVLPVAAARLAPREGERIVIAEADPQGSLVGTRVREELYSELLELLGRDAFVARTIAGDISSNGTVGERAFVEGEAQASGDVPTLAVKGDHDSDRTVDQLTDAGAEVLAGSVSEVDGLRFAGAADPEFKSLFGGRVTNPSGVPPEQRGEELRAAVDDELDGPTDTVRAVVHQNESMEAYLGLDSLSTLRATKGHETQPWDDGIPDAPAGSLTFGHWHREAGPYVVWNTDTDEVTWTVVDQLGTSGGVEESPTINRFSTPYSPPLKPMSLRLHYTDPETGLVHGAVLLSFDVDGTLTVGERVELGLPREVTADAGAAQQRRQAPKPRS